MPLYGEAGLTIAELLAGDRIFIGKTVWLFID